MSSSVDRGVEDLLRTCAPQVLGALVRRYGQFDRCEDAVQEALLAAARTWPRDGVPDEPAAWLLTVAGRKFLDERRAEQARWRREVAVSTTGPGTEDVDDVAAEDDVLDVMLLCAHPELSEPSRIALTLRAVAGLTTAEIARAFLVPEPTMAQRISRAKATIAASGSRFPAADRDVRLATALHVLYVVFTEGYTATAGPALIRADLTGQALALTRRLHRLLPDDGEITGLLTLMLLTEVRRTTRTDDRGDLVALADQDRSRWDRVAIDDAVALLADALARTRLGPYQLQAAIAAVHAGAASDADTDWRQIVGLYRLLEARTDNPVVTLNRAVAVGMADGPRAGLDVLDTVADDPRLRRTHRVDAVRAHLLERLGETTAAREHYERAARAAVNRSEQRYLQRKARAVVAERGTR